MKGILVLLVLLSVQTAKVCSQPYKVDSDGNCRNTTSEYTPDDSNLCCKKCRPGEHLKTSCTETSDSVCEPCGPGLYIENWNFAPNCFSCDRCRSQYGLVLAQQCSPTTKARCKCIPGMYCLVEFDDPYCRQCKKYIQCKPGFGVVSPGKANANVKCKACGRGTFSDTLSDTDRCQPHTECDGSAVLRVGNATSDTVCEGRGVAGTAWPTKNIKAHETSSVFMTSSTMNSTVLAVSDTSTLSAVSNLSTKSPPAEPYINLVAVIAGVVGIMLLFIFILLICLCKPVWKKDNATFPKVDANGNCESGDKINHSYVGETQLAPMKIYPSEEQCLLGNGEACSDHSLSNNNTESLTQTEGCNSQESIGPLQSTVALDNSCSALSEPMSLVSNTEPVRPLPSGPSQSPCQPTSPQIISPITTSPHVNVNITFHIGNGSGGTTPSVIPTNSMEADSKLPFGEEEKSYSIPQQEDGKRSQISVQDSESSSL